MDLATWKPTVGSLQKYLDLEALMQQLLRTPRYKNISHIDTEKTDLDDRETDLYNTDSLTEELEPALSGMSDLKKVLILKKMTVKLQLTSEEKHLEVTSNDKGCGINKSPSQLR